MRPIVDVLALPRRFYISCRDFGLPFTLYYVLTYRVLPAWLLQFGTFVVLGRPLHDSDPEITEDPEVRPATPGDRALLAPPMPTPEQAHWHNLIEHGHPTWVIVRNGRLVAISAAIPVQCREPDWLVHRGRADDDWGGHIWVAPDCRGAGIAGRVRMHVFTRSLRAGVKRRLNLVVASNRSAMRFHEKTGSTRLGSVSFVRLLGLAVVHAGRLWRCGWFTANRPLTIPIEAYDAAD